MQHIPTTDEKLDRPVTVTARTIAHLLTLANGFQALLAFMQHEGYNVTHYSAVRDPNDTGSIPLTKDDTADDAGHTAMQDASDALFDATGIRSLVGVGTPDKHTHTVETTPTSAKPDRRLS